MITDPRRCDTRPAVCRPMPLDPPVMSAVAPWNGILLSLFIEFLLQGEHEGGSLEHSDAQILSLRSGLRVGKLDDHSRLLLISSHKPVEESTAKNLARQQLDTPPGKIYDPRLVRYLDISPNYP